MRIKKLGILIAICAFVIYLIVGVVISVLTVQNSIRDVTKDLNNTITYVVADVVSEPMKLGSFIEARSRIQSFIKRGLFECATLSYEGMPISKCETVEGLHSFQAELPLSGDSAQKTILTTYVNENSIRDSALKKSLTIITFVFGFGIIYLIFFFFFLRRVSTEIDAISEEVLGGGEAKFSKSPIFEINVLRNKMKEYVNLKNSEMESHARLKISKQLAHDIRSPLMALDMALRDSVGIPEEKRNLLEQASVRIKSIAEDLLVKSRESRIVPFQIPDKEILVETRGRFDIVECSQKIALEKKTAYPGIDFVLSGLDGKMEVQGSAKDFERAIANLLQNSIEAVIGNHEPRVHLALRKYSSKIQLTVMDNGRGIPSEILSRIGDEGFTAGKENGNGLGVSFAKRKMKEWDGDLQISSNLGMGTAVTLTFVSLNQQVSDLG